ncbi:MAG: glycosyltransferase family 10 [Myxococcota bacterium]
MVTRFHGLTTYDGFHPRWRADATVLVPFGDRPWWVGSFYDARAPDDADIFYSNECPTVTADGERLRWSWGERGGSTRWFVGTPHVDHPRAFQLPFFYFRWGDLRRAPRPEPARAEGISFLAGNVAHGDLARARLDLAVGLARHVPVHTSERLRAHFPADSRAVFHRIGPTLTDKIRFVSSFDYNLAVENARHDGYLTEKPFEALFSGAVPIYAGDPSVGAWLEPEAMVDAGDLQVEAVLERVLAARRAGLPAHVARHRDALVRVSLESMMGRLWELSATIARDLDDHTPGWRDPVRYRARRARHAGPAERLASAGWRAAVDTFDALPAPLRSWVPTGARRAVGQGWRALMNRIRGS